MEYQLYDISEAITEHSMRSTIRNLPRDLSEVYSRILHKAYLRGGPEKIDLMRDIFRWVLCARRPLRVEELEEAITLNTADTYLHLERIGRNEGERLVSVCDNMVILNGEDNTIGFAHYTVRQFLCLPRTPGILPMYPIISLSLLKSHHKIGELCVAYLSFTDFETQLTKATTPGSAKVSRDEAEYMIWGRVPLGSHVRSLVSRRSAQKASVDHKSSDPFSFSVPLRAQHSNALAKKYTLLEYIVNFWAFHTATFSKSRTPRWSAFENLVLRRTLLFEFRPWQEQRHHSRLLAALNDSFISLSQRRSKSREKMRIDNEHDLNILLLYSWAMGHGVASLLRLSNDSILVEYFGWVYMANEESPTDCQQITEFIVDIPPVVDISFWDGAHISKWVNDVFINHPRRSILFKLLEFDFRKWVSEGDSFSHLIQQAISYSLEHYDMSVSWFLAFNYINTTERYRETIVSVVQLGRKAEPSLKTLFEFDPLEYAPDQKFLNEREYISTDPSRDEDLDFIFALHLCLPSLEDLAFTRPKCLELMPPSWLWLTMILTLVFHCHGTLAITLAKWLPKV